MEGALLRGLLVGSLERLLAGARLDLLVGERVHLRHGGLVHLGTVSSRRARGGLGHRLVVGLDHGLGVRVVRHGLGVGLVGDGLGVGLVGHRLLGELAPVGRGSARGGGTTRRGGSAERGGLSHVGAVGVPAARRAGRLVGDRLVDDRLVDDGLVGDGLVGVRLGHRLGGRLFAVGRRRLVRVGVGHPLLGDRRRAGPVGLLVVDAAVGGLRGGVAEPALPGVRHAVAVQVGRLLHRAVVLARGAQEHEHGGTDQEQQQDDHDPLGGVVHVAFLLVAARCGRVRGTRRICGAAPTVM